MEKLYTRVLVAAVAVAMAASVVTAGGATSTFVYSFSIHSTERTTAPLLSFDHI